MFMKLEEEIVVKKEKAWVWGAPVKAKVESPKSV
jgi:hypothetical protein